MIKKYYEAKILPSLINCCCATKPINYQRQKIIPQASGHILEIGIGSGLNLPYYNKSKVSKIVAIEPSDELNKIAQKNALKNDITVELITGIAENIEIEDKSIDTIIMTYTLCTIPDTKLALNEIKRVMKPDAKILFSEHGIAPDEKVIKWQNKINPIWNNFFGGCNLNRNIPHLIKDAGFKFDVIEQMYLPSTPKFIGYNYWGSASLVNE